MRRCDRRPQRLECASGWTKRSTVGVIAKARKPLRRVVDRCGSGTRATGNRAVRALDRRKIVARPARHPPRQCDGLVTRGATGWQDRAVNERVDDTRLRQALAGPLQKMLEATMSGGLTVEQAFSVVRRTLDDLEAVADFDQDDDED